MTCAADVIQTLSGLPESLSATLASAACRLRV
jgi:hypothetical protein